MWVTRQVLKQGNKLILANNEYKIIEEIGKGTSSIVYLAEDCSNSRLVLIKELYPKNLGIFRNTDNSLVIPASSNDNFEIYKSYLREAVKLQIEFHNSDELANSTSDAERIIAYNNTLYVVMGRVVGKSYDKVTPESLNSVLKICKSLTKAISFYHLKGYLHLDIKAENVFKIQETDELVKLFDFDSVHKKEDIINENCKPTYSESCAAPEVKKIEHGKYDEIDERSDIYSIGAMLFRKVMHRDVDTEDSRPKKRWNFTNIELLKTESPQAKSALTEIFRNTLARNKKDRYKSTDELIEALDKAIEITSNKVFLCDHNITTTTSKDYYISRADKVREIREKLENYHIAYLYGIGGIGKSETAREYAETYRNDYEVIHFTHYSIGLKETLSSLNFINLDDKDFKLEERYNVRLNMLSKKGMYNSNTLLIIDNYNVAPDSDEYKNNVEVMKDLKKLGVHILFTTRTAPNDGNRKIDIEELSDNELKQMFFSINSKDRDDKYRICQVEDLIEVSYRHTLTVDLVAHQTVQIERYGKKTLSDYIDVLKNSGLNNEIKISVYNNKDDDEKNDIIYEHIKALFNFSELTDKERYVMVNACLLPVSGMETAKFCEFIDLDNYCGEISASDWGENSTITNLVTSGWIKRAGEHNERIALHPTVASACQFNYFNTEGVSQLCEPLFNSLIQLYKLPKKLNLTIDSFIFDFLSTIWINIIETTIYYATEYDLRNIYKACFEYIMVVTETYFFVGFPTSIIERITNIFNNAIKKADLKLKIGFLDIKTFILYKRRRIKPDDVINNTLNIIEMSREINDENFTWYHYLSLYCYDFSGLLGVSDTELLKKAIESLENTIKNNVLFDVNIPAPVIYQSFWNKRIHTAIPKIEEISSNTFVINCIAVICNTVLTKNLEHYFEVFNYFWKTSDYNWNVLEVSYYYEILGDCYFYENKVDLQIDCYRKSVFFKKLPSLCKTGYLNDKSVSKYYNIKISDTDLECRQLYNISKSYKKEGNMERSEYYLKLAREKAY